MTENSNTEMNPEMLESSNTPSTRGRRGRRRSSDIKTSLDSKKEEILEEIYQEIKQLESQSWFAETPKLASKKQIILTRVIKAIEGILKYSMSYLRLFENHFNIILEYEIGKTLDKDGKPVMYIKLHKITLPEELNPELTETIKYEKIEQTDQE